MFWTGGLLALELTTSTPDALCPPLEEARAAVRARVGDVRGTYHAEFALVRGAGGQQVLELVVSDQSRQVLRRELPLAGVGCEDAAQAIALVLERYFDGIEMPVPEAATALPTPASPEPAAERPAPPASSDTEASPRPKRDGVWDVRVGLLYDLELGPAPVFGAALFPWMLRISPTLGWGFAFGIAPFLQQMAETIQDEEVAASTLQADVALPLRLTLGDWAASVGPWAHLRLQRAAAPSLVDQEAGYRALWGVGGLVQLGWTPWQSWTIGLGMALGAQLTGAAARFALARHDGRTRAVLVPNDWFGQAHLAFALRL